MHHISERIVRLRKERGLKQVDLSRKLGIPQSTLWGYENGERDIGAIWLAKIAALFGVSVDYLIGATEFRKGVRFLEEAFLANGSQHINNGEFFDRISKLTPENKSVINNMVEALLK